MRFSARGSVSTRSTPRPWTAACSTTSTFCASSPGLRADDVKIGLTLSGPTQAATLSKALEVTVDGGRVFDAVQATWNLLERSAESALQAAHEAGLGVIVKEALANGRLTARNEDPAFASNRSVLAAAARHAGTTIDGLALAAVLAQPWADVVLSGAATAEQLRSNVAALEVQWTDESDERLRRLAEPPQIYWARRSSLEWN